MVWTSHSKVSATPLRTERCKPILKIAKASDAPQRGQHKPSGPRRKDRDENQHRLDKDATNTDEDQGRGERLTTSSLRLLAPCRERRSSRTEGAT